MTRKANLELANPRRLSAGEPAASGNAEVRAVIPGELGLTLQPAQPDRLPVELGREIEEHRGETFNLDALLREPLEHVIEPGLQRLHLRQSAQRRRAEAPQVHGQFGEICPHLYQRIDSPAQLGQYYPSLGHSEQSAINHTGNGSGRACPGQPLVGGRSTSWLR